MASERLTDEEVDAYIRREFVPLYPLDKPLSEMTLYEQSHFRWRRAEFRRIEFMILRSEKSPVTADEAKAGRLAGISMARAKQEAFTQVLEKYHELRPPARSSVLKVFTDWVLEQARLAAKEAQLDDERLTRQETSEGATGGPCPCGWHMVCAAKADQGVGGFDSDCRCGCHDVPGWCTGCYERHERATRDGMGGGGAGTSGRPGGDSADRPDMSRGRTEVGDAPSDGARPARHPSDSPAQDEAEIERLLHKAHTDYPLDWRPGLCGPDCPHCSLASLARRLLRERDEAIQRGDIYKKAMGAAYLNYEEAAKQRDEARRLHDEHCEIESFGPQGCRPSWRPR